MKKAEMAQLCFTFQNNTNEACRIITYINGEKSDYEQIAPGVYFHGIDYALAAGGEVTRLFIIEATLDAETGTLPSVDLELKYQ